jgi:hypothetical protein
VVTVSQSSRAGAASASRPASAEVPLAVTNPSKQLLLVQFDEPGYLFLTQTVTLKEAFNNQAEVSGWHDVMSTEYHLLASKNTGTLVPPPGDDKVIGGMWLLSRKLNKIWRCPPFQRALGVLW